MKLLTEAAARQWKREHQTRIWLAWNIAALSRAKKLPDLRKMMKLQTTSRPRQTWRQQLLIFGEWAARRNAWVERQKEMTDGG